MKTIIHSFPARSRMTVLLLLLILVELVTLVTQWLSGDMATTFETCAQWMEAVLR